MFVLVLCVCASLVCMLSRSENRWCLYSAQHGGHPMPRRKHASRPSRAMFAPIVGLSLALSQPPLSRRAAIAAAAACTQPFSASAFIPIARENAATLNTPSRDGLLRRNQVCLQPEQGGFGRGVCGSPCRCQWGGAATGVCKGERRRNNISAVADPTERRTRSRRAFVRRTKPPAFNERCWSLTGCNGSHPIPTDCPSKVARLEASLANPWRRTKASSH